MNPPTFSVIVPVWNGALTLAHALDSVLVQTRPDWEAIVVDDASTDATADIVGTYVKRDPRVRLIKRASNGGAGSARNDGIAAAVGEWRVARRASRRRLDEARSAAPLWPRPRTCWLIPASL